MAYLAGRRLRGLSGVAREEILGHLEYRGFISFPTHALDDARTRRKGEAEIMIALAGLSAEHLYAKRVDLAGAEPDLQRALEIALVATGNRQEATAYLNWLFVRTCNRLARCPRAVGALADELSRRGSLTGRQVRSFLQRSLGRRPRRVAHGGR